MATTKKHTHEYSNGNCKKRDAIYQGKLIAVMPQVQENEHKNLLRWKCPPISGVFFLSIFLFQFNSLYYSISDLQRFKFEQHHHRLLVLFVAFPLSFCSFLLLRMNRKWHYWGSNWLVCVCASLWENTQEYNMYFSFIFRHSHYYSLVLVRFFFSFFFCFCFFFIPFQCELINVIMCLIRIHMKLSP